jgi:hypothetical protein
MVNFLLKAEGYITWSGCQPPLSQLTVPECCNPNVLLWDMSGITALETDNIFTVGFMAKIKVSFTSGTCLKPHSTPPLLHCGKSVARKLHHPRHRNSSFDADVFHKQKHGAQTPQPLTLDLEALSEAFLQHEFRTGDFLPGAEW